MTNSDDDNVVELIEINLMFAQMELSLGAGDDAATLRALDHIMEALKHLRDEMPGVLLKCVDQREGVRPSGDFS